MKIIIYALIITTLFSFQTVFSQEDDRSCFERLEKAFSERGSHTVSDDIHTNVIIIFFENGEVSCVKGKARVENGTVSSIFISYDDILSDLYPKKFYNAKKQPPFLPTPSK